MLESLGILILFLLICSPLFWLLATDKKRTAERAADKARAQANMPLQHCMTCGHEFRPAPGALRGSTVVEVILWLFTFGVIGILYSIWRRVGIGKAKLMCPSCSSNQVVPSAAPAAKAHRVQLERDLGTDFQRSPAT